MNETGGKKTTIRRYLVPKQSSFGADSFGAFGGKCIWQKCGARRRSCGITWAVKFCEGQTLSYYEDS